MLDDSSLVTTRNGCRLRGDTRLKFNRLSKCDFGFTKPLDLLTLPFGVFGLLFRLSWIPSITLRFDHSSLETIKTKTKFAWGYR
jgi:hypothetical protein